MINIEKLTEVINSSGVISDIEKFNPDVTFKENGIDSLDIFTIFLTVEESLDVKFSEEESLEIKTALEMLNSINSKK